MSLLKKHVSQVSRLPSFLPSPTFFSTTVEAKITKLSKSPFLPDKI